MWYGKDTEELIELKDKYRRIKGQTADGTLGIEYGPDDYEKYVEDLKTCIEFDIYLEDLYPIDKEDMP